MRRAVAIAALLLLTALAACGRKGDLEKPEGSTYPRPFPAPRTVLPDVEPRAEPTSLEGDEDPDSFDPSRTRVRTFGPSE